MSMTLIYCISTKPLLLHLTPTPFFHFYCQENPTSFGLLGRPHFHDGRHPSGPKIILVSHHMQVSQWVWKDKTIQDTPAVLTVCDTNGIHCPLQCCEPSNTQKTLGVHIVMKGSCQKQKEIFLDKARTFANQLQTQCLDSKEAWHAFTASFIEKIECPMPALSLSLKGWDKTLKPVLEPLCNKLGTVHNWT